MNTSVSASGGKKISTIFLQVVILALGLGALFLLLWEPHLEGRNLHATLFEIYFKDPFLAFAYIASIPFFVLMYKSFRVLGYVRQNKTFSQTTVKALQAVKYSAITQSVLIVMAGIYIRIFHAKEDDPAGFLALCIVATFICIVIATAAGMFERTLKTALDIKSENDLTV